MRFWSATGSPEERSSSPSVPRIAGLVLVAGAERGDEGIDGEVGLEKVCWEAQPPERRKRRRKRRGKDASGRWGGHGQFFS